MAGWDPEHKTEQPTPHRREEARRRGQGPRSRDLAVSVGLLGAFLGLHWLGSDFFEAARSLLGKLIGGASSGTADFTVAGVSSIASSAVVTLFAAALPIMAAACIVTASTCIVQGSPGIRFAALGPDLARIDPFEGARKLFNLRSAGRGVFAVLKMSLVAWFLARVLGSVANGSLFRAGFSGSARDLWATGWREAAGLGIRISLGFVVLGAIEYGFQRWLHERELRMTRADVLEEIASLEGNPELKRRRRRAASDLKARSLPTAEKGG